MSQLIAVILAAGMGTRMKSKTPKVMHKLCGLPMLQHIYKILKDAGIEDIVTVLGHQGEEIAKTLDGESKVVYQRQLLGTGHALLQALPELEKYKSAQCLVLCGDTPLLRPETLLALVEKHRTCKAQATVLTAVFEDPSGYGRIIKGTGGLERIVEERDASNEEKNVQEINTGTYCFELAVLNEKIHCISASNAQGEYYLTDLIKIIAEEKGIVETMLLEDPKEALGINNRIQLAEAEKELRKRILEEHMLQGVTIVDPSAAYIDAAVRIGRDTILYPGVILEGSTVIGEDCHIGPNARIIDTELGDNVTVIYSNLLEARAGNGCKIGPYSYLRPGARLESNVKVGDFVEIKNSDIGDHSKVPHLSYVGDSFIGKHVNVGAGTITCNYDGKQKHTTVIGDNSFIGSNTNLVAPITVGRDAYVGAGSTVSKDIPDGSLAVERGKQRIIDNWQSRIDKGTKMMAGDDKKDV